MLEALKVAVFCYVFTQMLEEGMILSFWGKWIDRLPTWLYKPLGGCLICFTGQVALWYYVFTRKYNFVEHLSFITLSMFIVILIDKIIWHLEK